MPARCLPIRSRRPLWARCWHVVCRCARPRRWWRASHAPSPNRGQRIQTSKPWNAGSRRSWDCTWRSQQAVEAALSASTIRTWTNSTRFWFGCGRRRRWLVDRGSWGGLDSSPAHGARAFALLRLGRVQEAAEFAIRGGRQPNARAHAHAIAALTLATAGRIEEAHAERRHISNLRSDYNFKQFEEASHLLDDLKDIYQRAPKVVQIPE